ncbi:hypothetical protein ALI144C_18040 [Actinosynnema sp. ALI-1.44]|uniref:IS701 family transposase n=1 Tax=Actinosynnema sp. ALI-1.44 TaxID=1933779 RepID=UPI00097C520D|nr:IS701 family transposase [Actinosynnema sp. ALI-1.44]ONI82952.1 hypothetical protein ALI144C_18040 [Actinosynnema sp. ALI-1.44]
MTTFADTEFPGLDKADELSGFCQELFSSLTRSDQRRWGEVYMRGLLTVPGRKSIRRISDHVVGWRADQCLQQFVNQSPWRWEPVRRVLAHHVAAALRPRAWIIEEAVFPKNGGSSVGVTKQYATSAQRTLNCQLGVALFMVGEDASCAANWRLLLPESWDNDPLRRGRVRLPEDERHRPRWQYMLDAIDEMVMDWGFTAPPIMVHARDQRLTQPLLRGLEERGLPYVIRVPENTPVLPAMTRVPHGRVFSAGELAIRSAKQGRITLNWRDRTDGRLVSSQYAISPVSTGSVSGPLHLMPGRPHGGARRVLAEWSGGGRRLNAVWITNLNATRLPELISLVKLSPQAGTDMVRLQDEFGLRHFEGRSYAGWHHHVSLVSAAHAYWTLRRQEHLQQIDGMRLRPHA